MILAVLPRTVDGEHDFSLAALGMAVGIALIGVSLGELGTRGGSTPSAWTGHAISAASLLLGATMLFPWPISIIGFLGFRSEERRVGKECRL